MQLPQNMPVNTSPVLQVIVPSPSNFPSENSPSQVRVSFWQTPLPCGYPLMKFPQQSDPSLKLMYPWPCMSPFFHSPSQKRAPSSIPEPLIQSWTHLPLQMRPSPQQKMPCPSRLPCCICPSYLSLFWYIRMPSPSYWSFCHSPKQMSPFSASNMPVPWRFSCLISP